jgi:hypothetical protein
METTINRPAPLLLAALALAASSCATMRSYSTPLTVGEGLMVVPALISAGQQQGLQAWRGVDQGAVVQLEDGTMLSWQTSADHRDFILLINLPGNTPEAEYDARFAQVKARADALWAQAVDARQRSGAAAVLVAGPSGATLTPVAAGPTDCRFGSDGQRACGYDCRVGSNGHAYCAATPDGSCHLNSNGTFSCGRNCRFTSSGGYDCQ